MVSPSCPALVIHDDDAFRKSLIATLDQRHFTVTYAPHGEEALTVLKARTFQVILLGLDLNKRKGLDALEYVRLNRNAIKAGVIILGEPNPELRTYSKTADETLLKPVDANYVADRAKTYCRK